MIAAVRHSILTLPFVVRIVVTLGSNLGYRNGSDLLASGGFFLSSKKTKTADSWTYREYALVSEFAKKLSHPNEGKRKMNEHEGGPTQENETPAPASQEQLYDDLRRIGQLEDQKREIQREIDNLTKRLQDAIPGLDRESLLYQLLTKAMPAQPAVKKRAATRAVKKNTKKK